ncbi:alanine racemase [Fusobacterium sp. PH5-44]|uniref:alanine racemase n=1 Tax=unclassified Fusobacterium TaxID=2648384 RepID=UPI003D1E9CF0
MISHSMTLLIDKSAIENNYNHIKNVSKKGIIPVLKSNGYGFGADILADILCELGQKIFAVARYSEAFEILNHLKGKNVKILVFESIKEVPFFTNNDNIIFSANSFEDLKFLLANNVPATQIHIKIDFGFARNGIIKNDFTKLYNYIAEKKLFLGGIYTHLFAASKSDQKDVIEQFENIIKLIGNERFDMIHMISSESYYNNTTNYDNYLRMGQLLYGIQEPNHIDPNIKKIFKLSGYIESIKNIYECKYIGYSEKRKVKNLNHSNMAIVKFGYGDGFLKYNENTLCLVNNRDFYISSISMDYTFINVDSSVKVGDRVEFYYDTDAFYKHFNKKIYEFLPNLSTKITRVVK